MLRNKESGRLVPSPLARGRTGSRIYCTTLTIAAFAFLVAGCDESEGPAEATAAGEDKPSGEDQAPEESTDAENLAEGEGVRPDDADSYSEDNFLVSSLEVEASTGEVYEYRFFATPEGDSAVVVQAGFDLPQPLEEGDVCPLHTFLKVAEADAEVPPALLQSCRPELPKFGKTLADDDAGTDTVFLVSDLRTAKTGTVDYDLGFRAAYCSGGDGGKSAFINARCDDIEDRVDDTTGPGVGWGSCAIYSMLLNTNSCSQGPLQAQKKARCDSHVTGGWLQLTGSLSIFQDSCYTTGTTKTRWQVAACVQPLEIKWKKRAIPGSFPGSWNHFTNVSPNQWVTMTLYAGTASSGYLCSGGGCWQNKDYRIAVDQDPGGGRFRVANGWATMQGKASSSSCTLDL